MQEHTTKVEKEVGEKEVGEKKPDENEQEGEMETDETTVEPVKDLQTVMSGGRQRYGDTWNLPFYPLDSPILVDYKK